MFFTFIPDDATLIEILDNTPRNLEIVSKKYPNILFEYGDTSNFFYALLDGEIVAEFSPIDWNDPVAMWDYNLKIAEYEALKKNYGKVVTIDA